MSSLFVSPRLYSMRALLPANMPKPYPTILKSSQASLTSQQPQALRLYVSHTPVFTVRQLFITLYAHLCRYMYLWSTGGGIGVGIHVDVGSGDESHVASTCLREGARSCDGRRGGGMHTRPSCVSGNDAGPACVGVGVGECGGVFGKVSCIII
ncbi:hypothetical protein B0H11DRAFT_2035559, partial [Mycena galericulata]